MKSLHKFLDLKTSPKVIYTDINTPSVRNHTVLQKEKYPRYFCDPVWMKHGGRAAQLSRSRVGREDSVRTAFWSTINRPVIPFGWMVQYHPISPKDQARLYQFGKKDLLDIFVGHALFAVEIWKDDTFVADNES